MSGEPKDEPYCGTHGTDWMADFETVVECVACQKDKITDLELQVSELRDAAKLGAKNISVWLDEGCGCDDHHVCGIRAVQRDLALIEKAIAAVPDKPKEDTCVLCKNIFSGTFTELKAAWCDRCEVYVCGLCRASHNMNAHLEAK